MILITDYADVRSAVEAIRAGAHDYLAKPLSNNEVIRAVLRALSEGNLKRQLKTLSNHIRQSGSLREIMGPSKVVDRIIADVETVAKSEFTVMITGETGSGKEVVARAIHQCSKHSKGPFIPIDCGAIPEALLESELFGHERGAFTGASVLKPGLFEVASGGTLFLDEIANMSLTLQAKMLRVLQEKTLMRVGGSKSIQVDARLIAATNRNLQEMVQSGAFRQDLYFRLNEFGLCIPPLRERKADISHLVRRFIDFTNLELGKAVQGLSEEATKELLAYAWPGNVRELRSVVRRAVLLADQCITEQHFNLVNSAPLIFSSSPEPRASENSVDCEPGQPLREIMQREMELVEREVLKKTLEQTNGNKANAARLLRIDYKTMHSKLNKYGLRHGQVH